VVRRKRQDQEQSSDVESKASSGAKTVAKKAAARKTTTKKTAAKKTTTKKVAAKKAATKKTAKKTTTKKVAAKKATTKKAGAKKTTTKKKTTKKAAAKKATTKKVATKKTTTRKTAAKKAPAKKTTGTSAGEASPAVKAEDEGKKKSGRRGRRRSERGSKEDSSSKSSSNRRKSSRKRDDKDGRRTNTWGRTTRALPDATDTSAPENRMVVVNEVPGEECRVAILDQNRLDEYFVERTASATVVGNIYKARVTNIEPAIQAAFVDFGLGESGFLHVSDLHPQYFPGEATVEQVGKKIPRRQRPPIQDALSKGQEILVQVLKQGIGSKGPTLTSYLSIPGRLMVMMPNMDRVGVSRKVADDDQRRSMREILDSLDLPEGFGFIVRTAGFKASKDELKRDVAYLNRLWDQIDRRKSNTGAPCLLYAESDVLIRTIRDVVDTTVTRILIDDPAAFERATGFLKVAAPRSAPDIRFYNQSMPIFSTYDVERQIDQIHEETVPLKSGGALVIQQTEALVAIDVNSGKSRSAKDSETNAYETNIEAVDEICRQLRLRDLGGVIINDLIDMRQQKHRQDIENRMVRNLGRDRAKTTVLPISEFGIVEMTRQRMRPNTQKANYKTCETCSGRGVLLRVDAVAADAIRRAAAILDDEKTKTVELVCSTDVASTLMNDRRQTIAVLEERFQKSIAVRVSDTMPNDRVDLYAYDSQGADLETKRRGGRRLPTFDDFPESLDEEELSLSKGGKKTGRRRRRRGKTAPADATAIALAGGFDIDEEETDSEGADGGDRVKTEDGEKSGGRKRRRRRGGRNRRRKSEQPDPALLEPRRIYALAKELGVTSREILDRCAEVDTIEVKNHMSSVEGEAILTIRGWFAPEPAADTGTSEQDDTPKDAGDQETKEGEGGRKRRRRRRGRRGRNRSEDEGSTDGEAARNDDRGDSPAPDSDGEASTSDSGSEEETDGEAPRKRRRRRGGRRRRNRGGQGEEGAESNGDRDQQDTGGSNRPTADGESESNEASEDKPKRRRSRNRSRKNRNDSGETGSENGRTEGSKSSREPAPAKSPSNTEPKPAEKVDTPRKPRTLYGGRIRRVGPGDTSSMGR
jgi:ribonuclease E